jgi:release factor glutamine methyltransferase
LSSQETWTVRSLLVWAREWLAKKGVDSPRLDSELLLAHALGCSRTRLYIDFDKPLTAAELAAVKPLLQRRASREPVAYILGVKEFYGRPFQVQKGVFIPRPETEILVQAALAALPAQGRALDLCSGSGAVGVTLAAEKPEATVHLVELSAEACACARTNAEKLAPGRVQVFESDLYASLPEGPRYDVITANPPYIPLKDKAELAPEIVEHEPHLALFGGDDGLVVLRRIVEGLAARLAPGGLFVAEIDPPQAERATALCAQAGLVQVRIERDLAGLDRHVVGRAQGG